MAPPTRRRVTIVLWLSSLAALVGACEPAFTMLIESIAQTADGALEVTGVLDGTATLDDGTTAEIVDQAFTTTATFARGATAVAGLATASARQGNGKGAGRCDILLLDLGPIFLDLLGLQVDLSQVVLDIDAVRGANNLLGNLLCALTGLLDPGSGLDQLLGRITGLLGG